MKQSIEPDTLRIKVLTLKQRRKGQIYRYLKISDRLMSLILQHRLKNAFENGDYVLTGKQGGKRITVQGINFIIKKECLRVIGEASIEKYHPHTFRHSRAIHLLDSGMNIMLLKNFLGHSNISNTLIYLRYSNKDLCGGKIVDGIPSSRVSDKEFNDFPFVGDSPHICPECSATMGKTQAGDGTVIYANVLIHPHGKEYFMGSLMGGRKQDQPTMRENILLNLGGYELPFLFAVSSIKNKQHVAFKATLSISDEIIAFQYGNRTLWVDMPLFKQAAAEFKDICKNHNVSKKNIGAVNVVPDVSCVSMDVNEKNYEIEIVNKFVKKYPEPVRVMLNWLIIEKNQSGKQKKTARKAA